MSCLWRFQPQPPACVTSLPGASLSLGLASGLFFFCKLFFQKFDVSYISHEVSLPKISHHTAVFISPSSLRNLQHDATTSMCHRMNAILGILANCSRDIMWGRLCRFPVKLWLVVTQPSVVACMISPILAPKAWKPFTVGMDHFVALPHWSPSLCKNSFHVYEVKHDVAYHKNKYKNLMFKKGYIDSLVFLIVHIKQVFFWSILTRRDFKS